MRVLVASDAIAGCDARGASEAIARAFHSAGAEVAVVVFDPELPRPDSVVALIPLLGAANVVDLRSLVMDDFGAALLAALGPTPEEGLAQLKELAAEGLTAVVGHGESSTTLAGIEGLAVARSREAGEDLAAGLEAEQRASQWLSALGIDDRPGAGAASGLGSVFLAAGAEVVDPFEHGNRVHGFADTARQADLIVTGCTDLDFHVKGGELVTRIVEVGEQVLRPVVAIAGRNFVSGRELRTSGIESAHAIYSSAERREVTPEEVETLAARVARTWRL